MELLIATRNKKKLREIKDILKDLNLKITSLELHLRTPKIIENGKSFCENAMKKAITIARVTGKLTLGEDSGLCVDSLGGKPGIYSSRFSGRNKSDLKNNYKLLKLLKDVPLKKRKAHYHCAVALADKNGLVGVAEGKCFGLIGFEMKGNSGFGYDPLFIIPKYNKTFAELGERIKHKMSHRFLALTKAKKIIARYLKEKKYG
ncbi:MAG: RdgB/HAM1 family non-canonical purine NTP pyrophosphatase [Candidatus Omnitrophica bacterium]|nr:RdgB/HAM1 family non-canonical purine NTP pyrophosphatase [Candidatus Omnitrophota bacterium]